MCVRWAWGWRWLCQMNERAGAGGAGRGWIEHQNTWFSVSVWWIFPCPARRLPTLPANLQKPFALGHDANPKQSSWDFPRRKSAFPDALWGRPCSQCGFEFFPVCASFSKRLTLSFYSLSTFPLLDTWSSFSWNCKSTVPVLWDNF